MEYNLPVKDGAVSAIAQATVYDDAGTQITQSSMEVEDDEDDFEFESRDGGDDVDVETDDRTNSATTNRSRVMNATDYEDDRTSFRDLVRATSIRGCRTSGRASHDSE